MHRCGGVPRLTNADRVPLAWIGKPGQRELQYCTGIGTARPGIVVVEDDEASTGSDIGTDGRLNNPVTAIRYSS